jgi:hypothetical protein
LVQRTVGMSREAGVPRKPIDLDRTVTIARQALAAIETLVDEWEAGFGGSAERDGSMAVFAQGTAFDNQRERATHLLSVFDQASGDLRPLGGGLDSTATAWHLAQCESLGMWAQSMAQRCAALDPLMWRSFVAAHHLAHTTAAAESRATGRRAELRALRLQEDLPAREHVPDGLVGHG